MFLQYSDEELREAIAANQKTRNRPIPAKPHVGRLAYLSKRSQALAKTALRVCRSIWSDSGDACLSSICGCQLSSEICCSIYSGLEHDAK